MICPRCGTENPRDARFCMRCGNPLARRCQVCGTENLPDAHFCLNCGAPLVASPAPERRVVTALFADLVSSTALTQRLDPERMRAIVARYFDAMREEIERHGGTVEKFIGDAVMAVFGLPASHEDDPLRAVRAGLAMQSRLRAMQDEVELQMRVGIATGEVVADPASASGAQFMVTGEAINLAARYQQHAPAGAVVVDGRTHAGTAHAVAVEPAGDPDGLGPRWQVRGLAERPQRLRAPMVGRGDELQFLQAMYRRVVEGRRHHLVTIIGAAGVGKTRLVQELLAGLGGTADPPAVMQGRCPAYGDGLTYWPVAEMLKNECGILDSDPPAIARDKLLARVREVCLPYLDPGECETVAGGLAAAIGIAIRPMPAPDPRAAGDELLRAWRTYVVSRARSQPLVLVFEDFHWTTDSLLTLLERMAIRGADVPILTLCPTRPELLERHPEWGGRIRDYTAVSLLPLSPEEGKRLVAALLGAGTVPAEVTDTILTHAEGNPLFIEEMLRALIDDGSIVRGEDGTWRCICDPATIRIPDTIRGLIASRLDLLSPLERRVVQDASVPGRVFWLGQLSGDGVSAAEAVAALARLEERELIEERTTSSLAGEREYAFTHALTREVAYDTLPKARRSDRHLAFARWLERVGGQRADEFLEVLAYHYEHAWRYGVETGDPSRDLARAAIMWLRRAGERGIARRTLPEARRFFERALAIHKNAGLDDEALRIELLLGHVEAVKWLFLPAIVFKETDAILASPAASGRSDVLARTWLCRGLAEYQKGRLKPAEDALGRALELFRSLDDRHGVADAYEVLGDVTADLRGNLDNAGLAYHKALEIYQELGDGQGMARTTARGAWTVQQVGGLAAAREQYAEALRIARQHHEPLAEANALGGLAVVEHMAGDPSAAERYYRQAIVLRHEMGDLIFEAGTRRRLGMHYLRRGMLDEAERELEAARALRIEHGTIGESTVILRGLAEVRLARGDLLGAAELAEQAVALLDPEEDDLGMATHGATLAMVLAAQGRTEEAEALFKECVARLEDSVYRLDLALTLLRYGEALAGRTEGGRQALVRARQMLDEVRATNFVREIDRRLAALPGREPQLEASPGA